MPIWIIAAALGSIAITALLTLLLWRLNAPMRERAGNHAGVDASIAQDWRDAGAGGDSDSGGK